MLQPSSPIPRPRCVSPSFSMSGERRAVVWIVIWEYPLGRAEGELRQVFNPSAISAMGIQPQRQGVWWGHWPEHKYRAFKGLRLRCGNEYD